MTESTDLINKAVLEDDLEIQSDFMKHFQEEVIGFVRSISQIYEKWQEFDSQVNDHEQRATVSALLFYIVSALINSLRLLVRGYSVASGNLMRHAIEALAMAILCSKANHTYFQKFLHNRFSVHKALDRLASNRTKFGVSKAGVERLIKGRKFYDQYSHPTGLTVTSVVSLKNKGDIYLGPNFDEGKLDGYEKEFKARRNFAASLVDAIEGIRVNATWE